MFDATKIEDTLEKHNVDCLICKERSFTAQKNPSKLNEFETAIVTCNKCGFVLFFKASKFQ